ncbi:MAG: peptidoglycan-associated lipoprotein Pal [Caulobacter sp.]|nr:peptidoglycan-associated lipoprotein Pal [Caulobacter sp.]
MRFDAQRTVKLALIAAAALSLAACASTKPATPPQPGPAGPAPSGGGSYIPPAGPGPIDSRPIPGTTQDFIINIGDFVYFDLDQYVVRADAAPVLDAQSAWLRRWANVRIRIEGNCDERGTREYNLALGSRRANAVREYLIARGVAPSRITTLSNGKERPIDAGTSEEAYQRNRNGQTVIVDGAR